MTTQRFVARYRGGGAKPAEDVERIGALPQATVLDDSSPRMVLVESPEAPLRDLVESLPGWSLVPDAAIDVPDTRKRVERPPDG